MYANLFNDYCFSCTNFGHMARNWKAYDRYNYKGHYQNPRSKVVGTPDRIHDDFDNKKYMSFVQSFRPNIECYKYHNYGHIAHNCRYKMEPSVKDNPNIRYKKIQRRNQMQEDQANEKVFAVMLSSFVKAIDHEESTCTLNNDKIQDDPAEKLYHTLI